MMDPIEVPKPKKNRVRADYYEDFEIKKYLSNLMGGFAWHVRRATEVYVASMMGNQELLELREEVAAEEPKIYAKKKRIEEIEKIQKLQEDEKKSKNKRIDDAHSKLLEILKTNHNRIDLMQHRTYKLYSDFCGGDPSPEAMKTWLEEEVKRQGSSF